MRSEVEERRQAGPLVDRFGRTLESLRVSVTDRCNLRCSYCLPEGSNDFGPTNEYLSFDEIVRLVRTMCRLGVDRVRITGGEPLLRPGLPELIARLKQETAVRDLAMTTNGVLLSRHADELARAGLDRLTVSADSLGPERFEKITRWGRLDDVWAGVKKAAAAGLRPVKINVVVLRGMNDDEIDEWVRLTADHELSVRFLELMPIGEGAKAGNRERYVNLSDVRRRLEATLGLLPANGPRGNGPARYFQLPGGRGTVGFITPMSESYCDTCSRLRVTATGELRPCLAYDLGVSLRDALRANDEAAVEAGIRRAVEIKPEGHAWRSGQVTRIRMSGIGG